ncbi:MAG TPA: hypothetical protein VHU13_07600 [Solirubrobacteraceae bacterium]|jgi:hypothetical protein|nr:hypothetical protein [Solirubrobacteraceae bacterium]
MSEGDFQWPHDLAVDPADNSVYVVDTPEGSERGSTPATVRIQKFGTGLGAPTASVSVPTPTGSSPYASTPFVAGVAVDSQLERLYVLEDAKTTQSGHTEFAGYRIVAYSTKETGKLLTTSPSVKLHGEPGVFYVFPPMPETEEPTIEVLSTPQGIAVEPGTHDLVVLGVDSTGNTLVQRISTSGPEYTEGKFEAAYDDGTAHAIAQPSRSANGLVVPAEGTIYLVARNAAGGSTAPGVVELSTKAPASMENPAVTIVEKEPGTPGFKQLTGGIADKGVDAGAAIAAAPDRPLIYAFETNEPEEPFSEPATPGVYEIRGMSTTPGPELGSQQIVYGGKKFGEPCSLTSKAMAVAAGSGGVLYALDEGGVETNEGPTSFGFDLVKFGPAGSGCPIPSANFSIDGEGSSETVAVKKGEAVKFDAGISQLNGEEPEEVLWDLDGSGKYATKITGSPASLTTSETYITPGIYTIGVKVLLSKGGAYGDPAPVTKVLEVEPTPPTASFEAFLASDLAKAIGAGQSIKPEESVTFNAEGSVDPTGECVLQPPSCKQTTKLKSYTWTFGDGKTEKTSSPQYTRAFSNSGTTARAETVSLTVTNEENVESMTPATQTLTIEGKEAPITTPPIITPPIVTPPIVTPLKEVPNGVAPVRPLTRAQKLVKALKACKKVRPRKRRLSCEKFAEKKYGAHHGKAKKKSKK